MKKREYTLKEFKKILENNGYTYERSGKGSHIIYTNGTYHIAISNIRCNRMMAQRLIREYDLKNI